MRPCRNGRWGWLAAPRAPAQVAQTHSVSCEALTQGVLCVLRCATAACGHPVAAMASQAGEMTGMLAWRICRVEGSCIMCEVAVSAADVSNKGRWHPRQQ